MTSGQFFFFYLQLTPRYIIKREYLRQSYTCLNMHYLLLLSYGEENPTASCQS
jgi:hypothetical protein